MRTTPKYLSATYLRWTGPPPMISPRQGKNIRSFTVLYWVAFLQWMNCRLEADTNLSSLWVWLWMVIVTPRNSTISLRFNSNAPLDCAWDRKKMPWLTLETMYMWQVTEALISDTLLTEKPVCPVSFCFLIDMQLLLISQCPLFWTKRVH